MHMHSECLTFTKFNVASGSLKCQEKLQGCWISHNSCRSSPLVSVSCNKIEQISLLNAHAL